MEYFIIVIIMIMKLLFQIKIITIKTSNVNQLHSGKCVYTNVLLHVIKVLQLLCFSLSLCLSTGTIA